MSGQGACVGRVDIHTIWEIASEFQHPLSCRACKLSAWRHRKERETGEGGGPIYLKASTGTSLMDQDRKARWNGKAGGGSQ